MAYRVPHSEPLGRAFEDCGRYANVLRDRERHKDSGGVAHRTGLRLRHIL